jgi:hypothetical protein
VLAAGTVTVALLSDGIRSEPAAPVSEREHEMMEITRAARSAVVAFIEENEKVVTVPNRAARSA